MSLRLSTLDSSEPRASKDCRKCNRRRIRCDRSLPTCRKCALKDLQCPGYSLRIQWDQGIASRGKFRGKTLPLLDPLRPSELNEGELRKSRNTILSKTRQTRAGELPLMTLDGVLVNRFALNMELSYDSMPSLLHDPSAQALLQYYDHAVAGVMPWMDGPDNPWRTMILPLALECSSLLHAILALAAEHRGSRNSAKLLTDTEAIVGHHRHQSLQLLAQGLRVELKEYNAQLRQNRVSGLLATILVLCNVEMVRFDPELWRIHWSAARTIVERWTGGDALSLPLDERCRFLVKEAFVYDVFASSTCFADSEQVPASVVQADRHEPFVEYLRVVQEVTQVERRHYHTQRASEIIDIDHLTASFDCAKGANKAATKDMIFATATDRQDFETLIDIFHHAGFLYGLQTLPVTDNTAKLREQSIHHFTVSLSDLQNPKPFEHDLVWPLFIAGTEARASPHLRALVSARLPEIMRSTGFSNCHPALEFLQRFWCTDPVSTPDWLAYARAETVKGVVFFVI